MDPLEQSSANPNATPVFICSYLQYHVVFPRLLTLKFIH